MARRMDSPAEHGALDTGAASALSAHALTKLPAWIIIPVAFSMCCNGANVPEEKTFMQNKKPIQISATRPTAIRACSCVHPLQDKLYGKGMRAKNRGKSGDRCTACGRAE